MALIKCPNCGAEISDRGAICPKCRTLLKEPDEIETSGQYQAVHPGKILIVISLILFLIAVAIISFGVWLNPTSGWLFFVLLGIFVFVLAIMAISAHMTQVNNYNLYLSDKKAFQEKMQREYDRQEQIAEQQRQAELERLAKLPACPICGSKEHVKRLTNLNRSASVLAVGIASAKIGKQYECTYCKHYF